MKRKPTRRDLLIVIGRLQDKIGRAMAEDNDRNPNRAAQVQGVLTEAFDLCNEARAQDPSIEDNLGPWGEESPRKEYA